MLHSKRVLVGTTQHLSVLRLSGSQLQTHLKSRFGCHFEKPEPLLLCFKCLCVLLARDAVLYAHLTDPPAHAGHRIVRLPHSMVHRLLQSCGPSHCTPTPQHGMAHRLLQSCGPSHCTPTPQHGMAYRLLQSCGPSHCTPTPQHGMACSLNTISISDVSRYAYGRTHLGTEPPPPHKTGNKTGNMFQADRCRASMGAWHRRTSRGNFDLWMYWSPGMVLRNLKPQSQIQIQIQIQGR